MFSDDDLIELVAIDPPANQIDVERYENEIWKAFLSGNINHYTKKMEQAKPLIDRETRSDIKQNMLNKYNQWKTDVTTWKSYIAFE